MVTKTIFNRMNRILRGWLFCFVDVSAPVVKDRYRQPTNASGVGSVACSVRTKRRKMEGAHIDSNFLIAKDSLMNFAACY